MKTNIIAMLQKQRRFDTITKRIVGFLFYFFPHLVKDDSLCFSLVRPKRGALKGFLVQRHNTFF